MYNSNDNNNFQKLFERGNVFSDWATDKLAENGIIVQTYASKKYQTEHGEGRTRIEFKLDNNCTMSNRLSIEIAEKSPNTNIWTPSGIMRKDNTLFYCQGRDPDILFLFSKKTLLRYYQWKKPQIEIMSTLKKFYVEFEQAEDLAELVIKN